MAFCVDSTIIATLLTSPPRLRLDIVDTPIGCTLPGAPAWHGFRFTTDKTKVSGLDPGCAPLYNPADGAHGPPPLVNFFSTQRVEVPTCNIFSSCTVECTDQFDFTERFFFVFLPSAGGGGGGGGCDYSGDVNAAFPVVFSGSLGSGPGPLTFVIDVAPTLGSFSGVAPNLTYTPGVAGTDSFTFHTFDGANSSPQVTSNICVFPYPLGTFSTTPIGPQVDVGPQPPGCHIAALPGTAPLTTVGCVAKLL